MSPSEADLLGKLPATGWCRPRDLGGKASSGHSTFLTRMTAMGWVERRERPASASTALPRRRTNWEYRITQKGREALAAHRALHRIKDIMEDGHDAH